MVGAFLRPFSCSTRVSPSFFGELYRNTPQSCVQACGVCNDLQKQVAGARLLAPDLRTVNRGGMRIGGFHYGVVSPMVVIRHIGESGELADVLVHIALVGVPAEQSVHKGNDFGTSDRLLSTKGAITIAEHPAVDSGVLDIFRRPIALRDIGELGLIATVLLKRVAVLCIQTDRKSGV